MNGQGNHHHPQDAEVVDPPHEDKSEAQRVEKHLKRHIFRGFIVLIPLLVTFLVLRFVINYVDSFFRPHVTGIAPFLNIPGVGVIFTVVLLYLIGLLVSAKAGRRAINWQDALLTKIPIVKSIYGVTKQATDTLTTPMGHQFSRVVFVEWPRQGYMALGFVTGHCHIPAINSDETLLVIYIPTVPNPTSGNLAFVSEKEVVETDMTIEDAMKMVFSGGIVLPDQLKIAKEADLPAPDEPQLVHPVDEQQPKAAKGLPEG